MKTSELIGPTLDWAVEQCASPGTHPYLGFHPSTDWAQGGPIIEREGIALRQSKGMWYAMHSEDLGDGERAPWNQFTFRNVPYTASTSRQCRFDGPTPLIAAMRCYVASKVGPNVNIPPELLQPTTGGNTV